jgi:diguanylate cyclase (GGDEF)-like protein
MARRPDSVPDVLHPQVGEGLPSPQAQAAASLLPSVSIVEQTMAEARRALVLVLAVAGVLLGVLLIERWYYAAAQGEANHRHAEALRLAGAMRLVDLQLTTAAQMAVISGQAEWVQRFDRHLPEFNRLLAEARALAPADATARFDAATGSAAAELDDMRESAFEAVQVGAVDVARRIFEGERYRQKTALLQKAIADFSEATVTAAGQEITNMRRRNALIGVLLLVGACFLGVLLWRRLMGSRGHLLRAEERVKHLAASDLLTGLPNRTALHDAMAVAMGRTARGGTRLAVLMIDLDRFKPVNDRHGHMVGDLVLKEVAQRLQGLIRSGDTCARYGGDEFVVLAADEGTPSAAHHLADRIVQAMGQPMKVGSLSITIGSTVGIARFPDDGTDADELLRKADSALYRAKSDSRGGLCFYDVGLDELVAERAALEQAMREGIARGEFVPYAQPIVDLSTGRVHSLELLARWHHPQRGLLPPAQFIPLAEETGLIGPMTMAVLGAALSDRSCLDPDWRISFNVAPQQIQDESLVPQLLALLARHRVPPSRLDVELTESALVRDTDAARRVMHALKQAGFTVTLDDFGTGHSSLSYLAELEFDKIKIDRTFVHTMRERPESAKIVDAIIGLSRSLGVPNVAEGIETEADAQRLRSMGCLYGQGYLYGRPMPLQALSMLRGSPVMLPA